MKLAHLGFSSYVIGDVTTPSLKEGDLLIAISQSGKTSTILTLVKKAKKLGGSLLGDEEHKNTSGALFGMNIFALFYGLICELAARTGQSPQEIDSRHANIE